MKKAIPVVVWNDQAAIHFRRVYDRIKEESYTNAKKVKIGIAKIIDSLPGHPEKYPRDKFKKDNPGNYRAFEKYSYRVSYKHSDKEIRILRIRHVKQEPMEY